MFGPMIGKPAKKCLLKKDAILSPGKIQGIVMYNVWWSHKTLSLWKLRDWMSTLRSKLGDCGVLVQFITLYGCINVTMYDSMCQCKYYSKCRYFPTMGNFSKCYLYVMFYHFTTWLEWAYMILCVNWHELFLFVVISMKT